MQDADALRTDLSGILESIDLPIIVVGRDCRLVRFNRAATAALQVAASDVGQSLEHIQALAAISGLDKRCAQVIADDVPSRCELREGDRSFLIRIAPLVGHDRRTDGAVITFTNVTAFRASIDQAIHDREFTKTILNTIAQPLVVVDAELRVLSANRPFYSLFHVSREDAHGVPLSELAGGDWRTHPIWTAVKSSTSENDEITGVEVECELPVVGSRSLLLDARRLPGSAPRARLLVFQDITERQRADAALRESEQRYRVLFEASPVAVYTCHVTGVISGYNRRAAELWGREPKVGDRDERFCGSLRLYRPDGTWLPHEQCPMAEVLSGHVSEVRDMEIQIERPDGSRSTVIVNIRALKNERGDVTGAINYFIDITHRKHIEQKLMESEERFRAFVTASSDVVYRMSPDWVEMRHLQGRDFIPDTTDPSRTWIDKYIHPDDQPHVVATIQEAIRAKSTFELEHRVIRVDGTLGWTFSRAIPLLNAHGEIVEWFGAARDVTDRRRAEDALRRSEADLREANDVKDKFLATLSHELRTPLNAILGWSHMLQNCALPAGAHQRALESLVRNARAQAQLVDDLLDVSGIMSGKLQMKAETVDLGIALTAAVDTVRLAASAKRINVSILADPDLQIMVHGDPDRLQQVVWNLLSNAIKFSAEDGLVTVELRRRDRVAELVVTDTGVGIAPSFLPHVFDRFRQADSTPARVHGGLGLGLSIVHDIVVAHGGTVTASSAGEGQGATFVVRLPIVAVNPSATPMKPSGADRSDVPVLTGVRVLVVDDEPDARDVIRALLEQRGADVATVASAGEALYALQTRAFDVLVSDIGMPGQDGYALIQAIRALPSDEGGRIPAVAVTAYAGLRDRDAAITAGYNWHVSKPFDPEQLIDLVSHIVGSGTI